MVDCEISLPKDCGAICIMLGKSGPTPNPMKKSATADTGVGKGNISKRIERARKAEDSFIILQLESLVAQKINTLVLI